MKLFLLTLPVLFLPACTSTTATTDSACTPNIIIVLADDLGYGDLSCYGQTRWRTPNLDLLAAQGSRFTNFYVSQSVCSASRAAILTGCYSNRVGIAGALGPKSTTGLNPVEVTIADLCASRGYRTAAFGKWHLGSDRSLLPLNQGFSEFCGIPCSNDMWPLHPDLVKLPENSEARKRGYPPLPLWENSEIIDPEISPQDQMEFTKMFTERACRFIRKNADHPFLLYLAHPMPHVPLFTSAEFVGHSGAGVYGDVVEEIDWSVGQIVAQVTKLGLRNRTLILFLSDNGPWLSYGNHAGTTGGLREGKGTSWEGGVREPFIASWPGTIPAGTVCHTPAMTIDILPTIASIINAPLPEHRIDGKNIRSLLIGGQDSSLDGRALAFYYNTNDLEAVRMGRWKLILPHSYRTLDGPPGTGGSPGNYKQVKSGLELYDLEIDPAETHNLAAERPEIVAGLQIRADLFRADLGDSLTNTQGTGRRPAANLAPREPK